MFIATVIFIVGYRFYSIQEANKENVIGQVFRCIIDALYAKFNGSSQVGDSNANHKKDWLDYAPLKYKSSLVSSTRSFIKVLVILLPLPFYHALSDQQASPLHLIESGVWESLIRVL
jgi:solute carrier family 15 oligopeptide transporter 1